MVMPTTTRRYAVEEVLAFPADGNRYELVHGELLVTPAPGAIHQILSCSGGSANTSIPTRASPGSCCPRPTSRGAWMYAAELTIQLGELFARLPGEVEGR